MGSEFGMCCGDRQNSKRLEAGGNYMGRFMDTWQHPNVNDRVLLSAEEAYMMKKQKTLNIHFITCDKIKQRFQIVETTSINQDIE